MTGYWKPKQTKECSCTQNIITLYQLNLWVPNRLPLFPKHVWKTRKQGQEGRLDSSSQKPDLTRCHSQEVHQGLEPKHFLLPSSPTNHTSRWSTRSPSLTAVQHTKSSQTEKRPLFYSSYHIKPVVTVLMTVRIKETQDIILEYTPLQSFFSETAFNSPLFGLACDLFEPFGPQPANHNTKLNSQIQTPNLNKQ